jgi:hypothetical protein
MQRISLNESDFKKLVRGEIVTQGDLQAALQDVGHKQMLDAVAYAVGLPNLLPARSLSQDDEEIRRWIHGINQHEPTRPGDFLLAFAAAVCRADDSNYSLMRPAIIMLMSKFPKYRFSGEL